MPLQNAAGAGVEHQLGRNSVHFDLQPEAAEKPGIQHQSFERRFCGGDIVDQAAGRGLTILAILEHLAVNLDIPLFLGVERLSLAELGFQILDPFGAGKRGHPIVGDLAVLRIERMRFVDEGFGVFVIGGRPRQARFTEKRTGVRNAGFEWRQELVLGIHELTLAKIDFAEG